MLIFNQLSPRIEVELGLYILKNMGNFAWKPEDMGKRYSAVAEAAKMHDLPDKDKLRYLNDMISEEEILDMREATLEEGREEGRKEGREEQRIADAKAMLRYGIDVSIISDVTQLSEDEIKALR